MDRLGESAKKGLDFLKSRAQETVAVQQLSSTVKQLKERREQALLDLGHRVMVTFGTEDMNDDVFRDRVEEVRALTLQIERKKSEHDETKEHLKQSVEDILPIRSGPTIPGPEYDKL